MSALNQLTKIGKHKLDEFQSSINSLRAGLLSNDIINEWKALSDEERKTRITAFLCMAMIPEHDLKVIADQLSTRRVPYKKWLQGLAAIVLLYLAIQFLTYLRAAQVYPKALDFDVSFNDGSLGKYSLFDHPRMLRRETDSGVIIVETSFLNWLFKTGKQARLDSTVWTTDEGLSDELKRFCSDFQEQAFERRIAEQKRVPLGMDKIYQSAKFTAGVLNLRMDLFVPEEMEDTYSPMLFHDQAGKSFFFLTVTDGTKFWNLKINFENNKVIKSEQIVFTPVYRPENQRKVVWEQSREGAQPALKIVAKGASEQSGNYYMTDLTTPIAKSNPTGQR